jgi:hypothetical protein
MFQTTYTVLTEGKQSVSAEMVRDVDGDGV